MLKSSLLCIAIIAGLGNVSLARAEEPSAGDLAKAAQNPIASMISLPIQNNLNFGVGPYSRVQDVLNIQPVIPISLNDDWNLITRWIVPVISQPALSIGGSANSAWAISTRASSSPPSSRPAASSGASDRRSCSRPRPTGPSGRPSGGPAPQRSH